ncbi:MAG TPA: VanZ family protein [Candidatus Sulfotelmatobacter sp.]|nr:VanZ family protein [Candidatus Sulfotelmatobacter sp.]
MPKFKKFLKYWLPVMVWMAMIFTASSDAKSYAHSSLLFEPLIHWLFPALPQAQVEEIHHLFRKTCHFFEYALLGLLLWRAVRNSPKTPATRWRWDEAGLALACVFLYAASDEFHQVFVPTRTALVSDVMIDTCGGATGLAGLWIIRKITRRQ